MITIVKFGEPTEPSEMKAYAIAYHDTMGREPDVPEPVTLDLHLLEQDWVDENRSGHTIYAAGDPSDELPSAVSGVDLTGMAAAAADKTVLTEREAEAHMLIHKFDAPRQSAARIMDVEPATVDTLRQRAEKKVEKAERTIELI